MLCLPFPVMGGKNDIVWSTWQNYNSAGELRFRLRDASVAFWQDGRCWGGGSSREAEHWESLLGRKIGDLKALWNQPHVDCYVTIFRSYSDKKISEDFRSLARLSLIGFAAMQAMHLLYPALSWCRCPCFNSLWTQALDHHALCLGPCSPLGGFFSVAKS